MDNGADPMPDEKGHGKVIYIREKRHAPRRRLWLPSHLIDEDGVTHACLLLELSTCGAAVRLGEAQEHRRCAIRTCGACGRRQSCHAPRGTDRATRG